MAITARSMLSRAITPLMVISLLLPPAIGQISGAVKPYPLQSWHNMSCRSKGRFQDREYCSSRIIDSIVADGKPAIPVLISQITDARWVAKPVYDYWPRIRVGELANFILDNLFVDDTWTKSTIPPLFPPDKCDGPSWECWHQFRTTHSLEVIQARWLQFWKSSQERIYWDGKARCFRLSGSKGQLAK